MNELVINFFGRLISSKLDCMLPELEILKTKSGTFCLFKNNDLIGQSLRRNGAFAEKETNLAINFAKGSPKSLVLDIGANLGAFAIPVAKRLSELEGGGQYSLLRTATDRFSATMH